MMLKTLICFSMIRFWFCIIHNFTVEFAFEKHLLSFLNVNEQRQGLDTEQALVSIAFLVHFLTAIVLFARQVPFHFQSPA